MSQPNRRSEGIRSHGTDRGGNGYIHPRSEKYRKNYDKIKWDSKCSEDCFGGVIGCDKCRED